MSSSLSLFIEMKEIIISFFINTGISHPANIKAAVRLNNNPDTDTWVPNASDATKEKLNERMRRVFRRADIFEDNYLQLYELIIGQHDLELRDKLEYMDTWDQMNAAGDVIALLAAIQRFVHDKKANQYSIYSAWSALFTLYKMK